jgi:hypothetical protein
MTGTDEQGSDYTGADLYVDALESYGVEYVFGNPGTTELPVVQALGDRGRVRPGPPRGRVGRDGGGLCSFDWSPAQPRSRAEHRLPVWTTEIRKIGRL